MSARNVMAEGRLMEKAAHKKKKRDSLEQNVEPYFFRSINMLGC